MPHTRISAARQPAKNRREGFAFVSVRSLSLSLSLAVESIDRGLDIYWLGADQWVPTSKTIDEMQPGMQPDTRAGVRRRKTTVKGGAVPNTEQTSLHDFTILPRALLVSRHFFMRDNMRRSKH